jgi:hypothetical protein
LGLQLSYPGAPHHTIKIQIIGYIRNKIAHISI